MSWSGEYLRLRFWLGAHGLPLPSRESLHPVPGSDGDIPGRTTPAARGGGWQAHRWDVQGGSTADANS